MHNHFPNLAKLSKELIPIVPREFQQDLDPLFSHETLCEKRRQEIYTAICAAIPQAFTDALKLDLSQRYETRMRDVFRFVEEGRDIRGEEKLKRFFKNREIGRLQIREEAYAILSGNAPKRGRIATLLAWLAGEKEVVLPERFSIQEGIFKALEASGEMCDIVRPDGNGGWEDIVQCPKSALKRPHLTVVKDRKAA